MMVEALAQADHDIRWVKLDAPGSTDEEVLQRAVAEDRVLITIDKDFGELVYRQGRKSSAGIVLFRTSLHAIRLALQVFGGEFDLQGMFSVVTEKNIRIRALPANS